MVASGKELKDILSNRIHGSSEILHDIYIHVLNNKHDPVYLMKTAGKIKSKFPHFPAVMSFIDSLTDVLEKKDRGMLLRFLNDYKRIGDGITERIFLKSYKDLQECRTILTISHSRTLLEVFRLMKKSQAGLKIFVCESRPLNEGIVMAAGLTGLKIRNGVITEAMSGTVIKQADAVMLGADQLLDNGNIVNKTGSRLLAVLAKHQGIPVYVFASSDKRVGEKISIPDSDFEEVEKSLIDRIFTD